MTALEGAQVRVAKAQEARDELHAEIMKKYGSQADLDMHCKGDTFAKKGGPRDLRRRYGAATKELRLAKSDLARMRNEEQQKAAPEQDRPEYMEAMDQAAEQVEKKSTQLDLEGKPAPEVGEGSETKKYHVFYTETFRVKISEDGLEKLMEKRPDEIRAWVQGHMRLLDTKKPVPAGMFDHDAEALFAKLMRG